MIDNYRDENDEEEDDVESTLWIKLTCRGERGQTKPPQGWRLPPPTTVTFIMI